MDSAVDIFLGRFWRQKQLFDLVSKFAKITSHIYVALKRTAFFCLQLCYSSSVNGNFKVQKKRSIWHVSAFIYSLSISIQQLFFRHERWPQEYFHISCGTILRKLNKTPWKILCLPSDHLRRMAPGICNIMGSDV